MTGTIVTPRPTIETLSAVMEFGHVIHVSDKGVVTDGNAEVHAPELMQYEQEDGSWKEEISGEGWVLVTGYSGQYAYAGPMMHASEQIGGRMADDILSGALPGYYVAVYPSVVPLVEDDDTEPDSWAIAHLPAK